MSDTNHTKIKLAIHNLDQVVKVCQYGQACLKGPLQDGISILEREGSNGLSVIINKEGNIEYVGYDDKAESLINEAEKVIDGKNCSLIPGLIDAHTHPIWAGDRCFEFDLKSRGQNYMSIHNQGGGIYFTVRETSKASYDVLLDKLKQTLANMVRCGTTTVECKTGYGLNYESELKQLQIANDAKSQMSEQVDLVITFLGAHAIPENMSSEQGTSEVLAMMKRIKEEHSDLKIDFVDVFCEKGVYNVEQTRRILLTGQSIFNCKMTVHGEELSHTGISEWCDIWGIHSLSHGEYIREKGILSMRKSGAVLVLCPNTVHILKINPPPCRNLIAAEVPIAIGSDFCPNANCYSMPMAMHLAVMRCGLTINEALAAATINAAYALNCSDRLGSIEQGKQGDLLLLNCNDFRHLIYEFGDPRSLIRHVIKKGNLI